MSDSVSDSITRCVYQYTSIGFVFLMIAIYILNMYIDFDYGFFGIMLPVFASVFHSPRGYKFSVDTKLLNIITFSFGLLLLYQFSSNSVQVFSLLAIPLLVLYSGKRGKYNLKYFFYLFYPVHLAVLHIIDMILIHIF